MMSERNAPAVHGARTTIFADAVTDVVVANGVARLSLAMTGPEGQPSPVATLCVPVAQLATIAGGLTNLLQQLQAKAKSLQSQAGAAPAADPAEQSASADAAFRFGS